MHLAPRESEMKTIGLITVVAACLGLGACSDGKTDADATATDTAMGSGETTMTAPVDAGATATTASTSASWPKDARIVEEDGVTYRIDADGTRIKLGDTDARIVVDNGVRYRVDPGGARIRLDERGLGVDVDPPSVRATADTPDIEVRTN